MTAKAISLSHRFAAFGSSYRFCGISTHMSSPPLERC